MTSYLSIFTALRNPAMGHSIDIPANKQEWKRFFGMMETLERAQIAEFKNGRYVLHPSKKDAQILNRTEVLLAEISKPLTLEIAPDDIGGENDWGRWEQLESLDAPSPKVEAVLAAVMPELNTCPACEGKGRVNIADALGFFGNFLCLTCCGKKQIPVPSRSTFPPVDLSAKRVTPNALLFSDENKAASIPQTLEVGSVRVIVEAFAPMVLSDDDDTQPLPKLAHADCPTCSGSGNIFDNASEHPYIRCRCCPDCGGTGELQELTLPDVFQPMPLTPLEKAIANQFPEIIPGVYVSDSPSDETSAPVVKPSVCAECGSSAMCHDAYDDPNCDLCEDCCWAKNHKCETCGKTLYSDDGVTWCETCEPRNTTVEVNAFLPERSLPSIQTFADMFISARTLPVLPSLNVVEAAEAIQAIALPVIEVVATDTPKQYVRINTTGRGLSSGKYELIRQEEKYGRKWMVVKFITDEGLPHWFPAEICELVVAPNTEPKAIEPVIVSRPSLLDGLPVFQALAQHGLEETKAALNAVATVAVAESLNGNKALLTEGQSAS